MHHYLCKLLSDYSHFFVFHLTNSLWTYARFSKIGLIFISQIWVPCRKMAYFPEFPFFMRFCVFAYNKYTLWARLVLPSIRLSICPSVHMSLLSNHWTILKEIWSDGSLWLWHLVVLVSSRNLPSPLGYKYRLFCRFGLIGSTPAFVRLVFIGRILVFLKYVLAHLHICK